MLIYDSGIVHKIAIYCWQPVRDLIRRIRKTKPPPPVESPPNEKQEIPNIQGHNMDEIELQEIEPESEEAVLREIEQFYLREKKEIRPDKIDLEKGETRYEEKIERPLPPVPERQYVEYSMLTGILSLVGFLMTFGGIMIARALIHNPPPDFIFFGNIFLAGTIICGMSTFNFVLILGGG